MSRRRRRREAPMPASSAGLLRFFEEESRGIRLRPEVVAIATAAFMIVCILAHLYQRGLLRFP